MLTIIIATALLLGLFMLTYGISLKVQRDRARREIERARVIELKPLVDYTEWRPLHAPPADPRFSDPDFVRPSRQRSLDIDAEDEGDVTTTRDLVCGAQAEGIFGDPFTCQRPAGHTGKHHAHLTTADRSDGGW